MTTIQDIAEQTGLSAATVSRSLRQDRLINPQTRARVLDTAMKLGYQGRSRQRGLSKQKNLTIGVVLANSTLEAARASHVVMHYLQGLSAEADAMKVLLSIQTIRQEDRGHMSEESHMPAVIHSRRCDVIIVQGRHQVEDVVALAQYGPLISITHAYDGVRHDLIGSDDLHGFQKLTKKLIDLGHRTLAWVDAPERATFSCVRQAGFLQACYEHGIVLSDLTFVKPEDYVTPDRINLESVKQAIQHGATGFVCATDFAAHRLIEILTSMDVRVPENVSVVGCDGLTIAAPNGRHLTTFRPDFVEMGRAAIRMALDRLARPVAAARELRILGTLADGETIAPPASAGRCPSLG